uniref:Uncharacterized protein n=1 Tax=Physcomitrium patens TaxID=3218 RepID=A0A2K1JK68_PHYPA|nr:hypothetical protein PHYPA_016803 [Physcomitrium patens]
MVAPQLVYAEYAYPISKLVVQRHIPKNCIVPFLACSTYILGSTGPHHYLLHLVNSTALCHVSQSRQASFPVRSLSHTFSHLSPQLA